MSATTEPAVFGVSCSSRVFGLDTGEPLSEPFSLNSLSIEFVGAMGAQPNAGIVMFLVLWLLLCIG